MRLFSFVLVILLSGTAFADKRDTYDIIVDVENPDYEVSSLSIRRIADDKSNKLFCHKLHWFLKPYWAPQEWEITLGVQSSADGEYWATVNSHWLHNKICKSALVTSFRVEMNESSTGQKFHFEWYTYNNGDETIMFEGQCSTPEDSSSVQCRIEETDRYFGTDENYILVEVNN